MKTYVISFLGYITLIVFFSSWSVIEVRNNDYNNEILEDKKCTDCHYELKEKKLIHAPVEDACDNCHTKTSGVIHPVGQGREFNLAETVPDLCFMCHDNIQTETQTKYPHAPTEDCSNCHNPHSSDNRSLLVEKVPELCLTCHDSFNKKHKHAPAQEGECLTCHKVHGSNNRKLLAEKDPKDLCIICHDLGMENSKVLHAPVEGGECLECHNVHDSDYFGLLKAKKPDLCLNCHDNMKTTINNHPILHKAINNEKSCTTCHSPHSSNQPFLIRLKEKELCLSCHNKEYTSETGTIKNIKEQLITSNHIHSPVEEGCSSCHDPHAGKYPYLLRDFYSPIPYTPSNTQNYELCFNCHDKEILTLKNASSGTNFRNGITNLHYIHLKGEKGRSCNICHSAHASKGEHLIREKTWFGQWEMPINYKPNDNGGSCSSGCHKKMEYSRLIGI